MLFHIPTGKEIKETRIRLRLTQIDLSTAAGVTQGMIARIEGETVDPSSSLLRKIVDILNLRHDQLHIDTF